MSSGPRLAAACLMARASQGAAFGQVAACVVAVVTAGALAGCGGTAGARPRPHTSASTAAKCGMARTSAGVPVEVEVQQGTVACGLALRVERSYAHAVASGKVPGNGGGAPVTIRGWVCQGFNTPQVLATGHTSSCRKSGTVILAVLPSPSGGLSSPSSR